MVARTFSKPQDARQVEARARARTRGVRVAVLVEARKYTAHSLSEPGVTHTLERSRDGWVCSCLGYVYTGMCHHLGALERRSEREGWRFGVVCPLSKAPARSPLESEQPAAPNPERAALRERARQAMRDLYGDAA